MSFEDENGAVVAESEVDEAADVDVADDSADEPTLELDE